MVNRWIAETCSKGGAIGTAEQALKLVKSEHSKPTYDELEREVHRLERIVDAAQLGLWDWNIPTGHVRFDRRWKSMLGYQEHELADRLETWSSLLHPDDSEAVQAELQAHLNGKTTVYCTEHRLRHKEGHWVWVLDIGQVVEWDEQGQPVWASGIHQEITERKKLEADLKAVSVRADAANEAKSRFIANMSHEIRTPLNVIIGACELLQGTRLNPTQEELRSTMLTAGESLLGIVDDILDLSKIESGKVHVERGPVDLAKLVKLSAPLFRREALERGLKLEVSLPEESLEIESDALKIRQILINLLSNAVKFTEQGKIEISLRYPARTATHVSALIEVSDTGIGMTPSQLERILNRFEQADSSITRRYGGTGLGTTICRHLADLLGGSLSVESRFGEGSRFIFKATFPLLVKGAPQTPEISRERHYGVTVLLAEDNELNRKIAVRTLEKIGIQCLLAHNGEEVLSLVHQPHELILMDCHMPVMDGTEAARRLRQSGYQKKIVAFTANVMTEDLARYIEVGMDEFLSKPLRRDALIDLLDRCLTDSTGHETPGRS